VASEFARTAAYPGASGAVGDALPVEVEQILEDAEKDAVGNQRRFD
jgi:hypothetical protein